MMGLLRNLFGGLKAFKDDQTRTLSATRIQKAYRGYRARRRVLLIIKRRYVKLFDESNDESVYKDRRTGEIGTKKPFILKNGDDLPTPRVFEAPEDYEPGIDTIEQEGWAVIVTVSSFYHGDKLPELPSAVNEEHRKITEAIAHDYVCKIPSQNVTSLFNPNKTDFVKAFQALKSVCPTNGFLVVYICTHIATALKGERRNKKETGYILMHDTDWKTPKTIASSSLSISAFGGLLNNLLTRNKTVLFNYAHQKKPPKKFFKASKLLYPPGDCLTRLADLSKCAVIGSCAIESLISDIVQHTPLPKIPTDDGSSNKRAITDFASAFEIDEPLDSSRQKRYFKCFKKKQPKPLKEFKRMRRAETLATSLLDASNADRIREDRRLGDLDEAFRVEFEKELTPEYAEILKAKYIEDWQIPPETFLGPSPKPVSPLPTWAIDRESKELAVALPTPKENTKFKRALFWWKIRRTFGPPANYFRKRYRESQKKKKTSLPQMALFNDENTLFGKAVLEALRGGASVQTSGVVTAEALFNYVYKNVKLESSKISMIVEEPVKKKKKAVPKKKKDKKKPVIAKKKKRRRRSRELIITITEKKRKGGAAAASDKEGDDNDDTPAAEGGGGGGGTDGESSKKTKGKGKQGKGSGEEAQNQEAGEGEEEKKEGGEEQGEATPPPPKIVFLNQSPIIIVPNPGHSKRHPISTVVLNPVCKRCSPPPPPDKPYVRRVGQKEVSLIWYNPPFDGVPPQKYKLYMRNVSRNFNEWNELTSAGTIARTQFIVRDLPSGVPCQFRIMSYNNGGWGQLSVPSQQVTPGVEQIPLSTAKRQKRLILGGPLAILDRLQLYPKHRHEHIWGLNRLNVFAILNNGFKKPVYQKKLAQCVLQDLETYPNDPEIAGTAFQLLGWTIRGTTSSTSTSTSNGGGVTTAAVGGGAVAVAGKEQIVQLCIEKDISDICDHYMKKFRSESSIINGIAWLRGAMPKGTIAPPPKIVPVVPFFLRKRHDDEGGGGGDDDEDFDEMTLEQLEKQEMEEELERQAMDGSDMPVLPPTKNQQLKEEEEEEKGKELLEKEKETEEGHQAAEERKEEKDEEYIQPPVLKIGKKIIQTPKPSKQPSSLDSAKTATI